MKQVALITGGAHSIGLAIARRLAADGLSIVIGDIQYDAAERAAHEMTAAGLSVSALTLDVGSEPSVAAAYVEFERRFGRLDMLINNAAVAGTGGGRQVPSEETSLADWEHTLRVNLTGTMLMCKGAIPLMRHGGFGRIVNISSIAARTRTGMHTASYAASKAAIIGLSQVLAGEVGRDGITVNCVAPSRMQSGTTLAARGGQADDFGHAVAESPVGRLGTPSDVAEVVAYLCSQKAAFITGTVLDVNGGSFMP